jgi:hypothetical protein
MNVTAPKEPAVPQIAHSYGRISTGGRKQAEGTGLLRQQGQLDQTDESWPEKVCREQGWRLSEDRYTDKGRSGFHRKNLGPKAALARILKLIEAGRILPGHIILMDKLDRLTRAEVQIAYDLFRDILRKGVWICTREPFHIYRADREQGFMDLMEPIWMMYSNWHSSKVKQDNALGAWRYQRAQARDKKRPHQARPPFWLRKNAPGRAATHYEPNGHCFTVARRIHEERWAGLGSTQILRKFEAEGVPAPTRSGRWNTLLIEDVLRGREIVGEYRPETYKDGKPAASAEPIPGYYVPAPLSEQEWQRTQALMSTRAQRRGRPSQSTRNLFRGLVRDAETREPMSLLTSSRKQGYNGRAAGRWVALAVKTQRGHHPDYFQFEEYVLRALAMLKPADVLEPELRASEREHELARLEARDTALAERLRQLQALLADTDRDPAPYVPAADQVAAELKEVRRQRQQLQQECQSSRAEALTQAQTLIQLRAETTDPAERQALDERIADAIPGVVSQVWIQPQHVSARRAVFHVQIWLHSGECRYFQLLPPQLHGAELWQLDPAAGGHDLRRAPYIPEGEGPDAAPLAEPA